MNANQAGLLDAVIARHGLKNDAALARMLEVGPPQISKIRKNRLPVGASIMLRMVEDDIMPLAEIRQFVPRVVV